VLACTRTGTNGVPRRRWNSGKRHTHTREAHRDVY